MKSDYQWLEHWSESLKNKVVLELGCGSGIDTRIISQLASEVVACDLAPPTTIEGALRVLKMDHSEQLPFDNNSFDVVVASLCLHYFTWSTTHSIVNEISRVLKNSGVLICRVNSEDDINYGAKGNPEIESGLYSVNGQTKRFFAESDVYNLFSTPWKLGDLEKKSIDRYENEKVVWEFMAVNL